MWSPKSVKKIFPSQRNKNRCKTLVTDRRESVFRIKRIRLKFKHADYFLYIIFIHLSYLWNTMSNESNARHIRNFVRLPNVSNQRYSFSCAHLKNCRFVFCSTFKTIFPSTFCQEGRQIAVLLSSGHNLAAFLVPVPWTIHCYVSLKKYGDETSRWS